MGGIGWTELRGAVEIDLFVDLASTLGKPDFVTTTYEVLEVTPTFQKFMSDAARSVCDRRLAADLAAPPEARILLRHFDVADIDPAHVDENLVALLRHFHSRALEPGSPALEPWRWLFRSGLHLTRDPAEAWRTVCVGLLTHPDFFTY